MAVVNTKSTEVSNLDSAVQTLNPAGTSHARSYSKVATVETAAADDDGSVYRFFRVHSSWVILSLVIYCDAITSGTDFDVGLYQTAANGGAVVDADAYINTIDLSSALRSGTEVRYGGANGGANGVETVGQKVWQNAALSADSNRYYDICATGNTVGSAAGTISMRGLFAGNV